MTTADAVIYLSDSRVYIQDHQYRSYQTLKNSFHDLVAFNDETLAAGASISHKGSCLIIPLIGDVVTGQRISPGQVQFVNDPMIVNPHKKELINYLLIKFDRDIINTVVDFELSNNQLFKSPGFVLGKFDGRRDDVYRLSDKASGIFVFAIEGAFEVQNRLLHPRDGLALWNLTEVEFEALSNDALLLLIEVY